MDAIESAQSARSCTAIDQRASRTWAERRKPLNCVLQCHNAGTSVFFYSIPRRGAPPLAEGYESSSAAAMATAAGATIGEHCGGQIQSTLRWWACGRSANGWGGSLQGDGGRNGVGRAVLFSSSVAALSWNGLCVYAEYMRLPCVAHSHRSACGQAILRPRYLNKNAGTLSRVIIWDNLGYI